MHGSEGADAGCFGYEFWRLYDQSITKEQIQEVIACYGKAAARAVEAGYDCLEFHLAHNYLPHSFLSAGFNHRKMNMEEVLRTDVDSRWK